MSKKLTVFKTDKEAEDFLDQDLSDCISAENLVPFRSNTGPSRSR
jgi:predicted DNA binding CopG/RHH family protein